MSEKSNTPNPASVAELPKTNTIHVPDDAPALRVLRKAGGDSTIEAQGSDGNWHELKIREIPLYHMVNGVPTTRKVIGIFSEPFHKGAVVIEAKTGGY